MKNISSKLVPLTEQILGCIGLIMIVIETYAVFARNILHTSTPWVDEALKLMFVWIVFVGTALCFRTDELISLTLIEDDLKEKFGALYEAFQFGAPPHAGMAPGIDRIVMLLRNEENIGEVIPFPMNGNAQDLMFGAPGEVSEMQLREVHVKIR